MDPVLRILFTRTDDTTYETHVTVSPSGITPSGSFRTPEGLEDIERLRNLIAHWRNPEKNAFPGGENLTVEDLGTRLFRALFSGAVHNAFILGRQIARDAALPLQLQLQFTSAPELAEIPWEFLRDPSDEKPLAQSREVAIVRYLSLKNPRPAQPLPLPLHILVMAAAPAKNASGEEFDEIDVAGELAALRTGLAKLENAGLVEITEVPGPRPEDLRATLKKGTFHAFHFIGHGDAGALYFCDNAKVAVEVSGKDLAADFERHRHLRLVVLNNCEGSRGSTWDIFSGVAQALVHAGIPAVIGMQVPITDVSAVAFSTALYSSLAEYKTIDDAVDDGRQALESDYCEWATPTLYCESRTPFVPPPPLLTSALTATHVGGRAVDFLRLTVPGDNRFTRTWGAVTAALMGAAASVLFVDAYRRWANVTVLPRKNEALASSDFFVMTLILAAAAAVIFLAARRTWFKRISLTTTGYVSLELLLISVAMLTGGIVWYGLIPPTIEISTCKGELPESLNSTWLEHIPYAKGGASVERVHQQVRLFIQPRYPPESLSVRVAVEPQEVIDFNRVYTASSSVGRKWLTCSNPGTECTLNEISTPANGEVAVLFDIMSLAYREQRKANLLHVTTTIALLDSRGRTLAQEQFSRPPSFDSVYDAGGRHCISVD